MIVKAETVFTDASGTGPRGHLVRPDDAANHPAFLNNTHGACHEAAAKDAWQMAMDFFKRNLV